MQTEVFQDKKQDESSHLKLYAYGSCELDQYYHPTHKNESRRPICISTIPQFTILNEDQTKEPQIFENPLYNKQIYKIACGGLHTCVLLTNGEAYTFGCNDNGPLGRIGIQSIPQRVQLDQPVDLCSAGDSHSVFGNSVSGSIYFMGTYMYLRGQKFMAPQLKPHKFNLSDIDKRSTNKTITKIVSGQNHTVILVQGKIFCRGQPQAFTLGRRVNKRHQQQSSLIFEGVGLSNVLDVWCGGYHTVAKVKKGRGFKYMAWGYNKMGQLGLNSYQSKAYPFQIRKLRDKDIVKMSGGQNFSIFLSAEGEVFGCGQNQYGQMGLGQNYEYTNSDDEQQKQLEKEISEKMNLNQKIEEKNQQKQEQPMKIQVNNSQEHHNKSEEEHHENISQQIPENQQPEEPQQPRTQRDLDMYIKSIKKIPFPQKIKNISAGSQFSMAWNDESLFTWGFGMNYVLLNGQEQEEYSPFHVKDKILNFETIYDIKAGGQHVVYLSRPTQLSKDFKAIFSQQVLKMSESRKKLPKRKRQ